MQEDVPPGSEATRESSTDGLTTHGPTPAEDLHQDEQQGNMTDSERQVHDAIMKEALSASDNSLPPKSLVVTPKPTDGSPTHGNECIIVSLSLADPEHPNNWPSRKKLYILAAGILSVVNSTLGSSLPSNAIESIAKDFGVTNELQLVLPISCYLIGFILGPTFCGPLSEFYGRKPVMLYSFIGYIAFTLGDALAPNWPAFLVFRWLCGCMAAAPIATVGGMYADVYGDPRKRGMAMAWFMAGTTFGPCLAPSLSGFISENVTWRWVWWTALIIAGITLPALVFMPESYVPKLTREKAERMKKETGNQNIVAKSDLNKKSWNYVVTVVMTRPFRMLYQEAIVFFTCAYLSVIYGIYYLTFQAWPTIFEGVYHMSPGIAGLAFLPIGIGSVFCAGIFLSWDRYLARAQKRGAAWAQVEEYRRLPLACVGGPLWAVSLFWIGWSASPEVDWIAPILSGLTLGMGFILIFMAMLNYLSDAYLIYAASAQGIASTCRSIFGVLLPFSARRMYGTLGIHWACSLLGFLSLGMAIIPFAFIKYGDRLKAGSKFRAEVHALRQQEEEDAEAERNTNAQLTQDEVHEKEAKLV